MSGGFNGLGTFVLPYNWEQDAANGIDITASRMDGQDQAIADGLSITLTRDGQTSPTAAISWGNQNLTNVATFSAASAVITGAVNANAANLASLIVSGNASAASLGVTGPAAVGGTLAVTGTASFGGAVNAGGAITSAQITARGSAGNGWVQMIGQAGSTNTGYVEFITGDGTSRATIGAASTTGGVLYNSSNGGGHTFAGGPTTVSTNNLTAALTVTDPGTQGANLKLAGNGATTPNKYIRAQGGALEFVKSDYSAVIASLSDTGAFFANSGGFGGTLSAGGAISGSAGLSITGAATIGGAATAASLTASSGGLTLPDGQSISLGSGAFIRRNTTTGRVEILVGSAVVASFGSDGLRVAGDIYGQTTP